jgi:hypothetical protein
MRTCLASGAVLAALLAAGCGSSSDDTKTFDQANVAFTFDRPGNFEEQKVDAAHTQGKVQALLGIDDNNVIAIRKFAPKELAPTATLKDATVSFATQNGVPAADVTVRTRSGIEMATFATGTTVDGTKTANAEWVFPAGGSTWQLECQSTPDHADEVRKACDTALDSIKAK